MAATLNKKQRLAIELLTNGEGLSLRQIAEQVDINEKTLWRWRNEPEYATFQQEVKRINDERWRAAEDAAREAAIRLCKEGKTEMVKFILQNAGYNPTTKLEADVKTDIIINIGEDE
jgi:transposase